MKIRIFWMSCGAGIALLAWVFTAFPTPTLTITLDQQCALKKAEYSYWSALDPLFKRRQPQPEVLMLRHQSMPDVEIEREGYLTIEANTDQIQIDYSAQPVTYAHSPSIGWSDMDQHVCFCALGAEVERIGTDTWIYMDGWGKGSGCVIISHNDAVLDVEGHWYSTGQVSVCGEWSSPSDETGQILRDIKRNGHSDCDLLDVGDGTYTDEKVIISGPRPIVDDWETPHQGEACTPPSLYQSVAVPSGDVTVTMWCKDGKWDIAKEE